MKERNRQQRHVDRRRAAGLQPVQVWLPSEEVTALKALAAAKGTDVTQELRRLVRQEVERK